MDCRSGGFGCFSRFALGQAIAFAVHLKDVDVMGQPVEERPGLVLGTEGCCPFIEGQSPVAVWCCSFDSIMCSKGDELWAQEELVQTQNLSCSRSGYTTSRDVTSRRVPQSAGQLPMAAVDFTLQRTVI